MVERIIEKLVNELGATGLLVVGLYWILYQPLRTIAKHMEKVNEELAEIRDCIKKEIGENNG